jgi:hypothetical protein
MSIHINRFIDRLQGFEARGAKDFIMPIADAKGMHADITRLLLELETLRENAAKTEEEQVITVQMNGGSF